MPVLVLLLISLGLWAPTRAPYAWPLTPARVVRAFDPPAEPWLAGHRGIDLAAPPVTVVRAAGPGRVIYAGVLAGRGVVSIQHPDGLRTTYEPVTPSVAAGDLVALGSPLGQLAPGHPGCPVAACLHWGLRRGDLYLDPLALLGLGRVRLLPSQGLASDGLASDRLAPGGSMSGGSMSGGLASSRSVSRDSASAGSVAGSLAAVGLVVQGSPSDASIAAGWVSVGLVAAGSCAGGSVPVGLVARAPLQMP